MYLLPIKCLVRVNASEQDKHAPHIPGVHRLRDWQTLKSHFRSILSVSKEKELYEDITTEINTQLFICCYTF
jgi:hypothetical protein